jgi:TPR repeat protein
MIQLAQIHQKRDGVEINISEAIHLYQMSITLNDRYSMIYLAQMYQKVSVIEKIFQKLLIFIKWPLN